MTGRNIVANAFGGLVGPLAYLVMTPFYYRVLGLEAVGLIGLFAMTVSVLQVFSAGVGISYQRNIAASDESHPGDLPALLSGGLLVFATLGLILGLILVGLGSYQFDALLHKSSFHEQTLRRSLLTVCFMLSLGMATNGASTTISALRDQLWQNIAQSCVTIGVALGCWLLLSWSPRIEYYYYCQAVGTVVTALLYGWRCVWLVSRRAAGHQRRTFREVWRERYGKDGVLALALMVHEGMGVVIGQLDRILISGLLPLASLGTYTLVTGPAKMAQMVTLPFGTAVFPEICALAGGREDRQGLGEYLGRMAYMMGSASICLLLVVFACGESILTLWLRGAEVGKDMGTCLRLLCLANCVLAGAGLFYGTSVAFGKVRFAIVKNAGALLILPGIGWLAVKNWGIVGAASCWLLYCVATLSICVLVVFRRHADLNAAGRWFGRLGLLAALAIILSWLASLPEWNSVARILLATGISSITGCLAMSLPFGFSPRNWMKACELGFSK